MANKNLRPIRVLCVLGVKNRTLVLLTALNSKDYRIANLRFIFVAIHSRSLVWRSPKARTFCQRGAARLWL